MAATLLVAYAALRWYRDFPALDRSADRRPTEQLAALTAGLDDRREILLTELNWQVQNALNQPPEMADFTVYFEDWRDADGVKFPFKMRRATEGATTEEWSVSKVKVNPKIDPKKFAGDGGS